ncbi:hypothetical protein, partial [Legionella sainthelensi]|uniref:hypothetical protein n=1 Tax=Legionella sainthelensi TaxID=28087 RepID=UPI0013596695
LLHVSSHRVIYQDDNQKHYSNQKISDREKNGDNIITIGEVSNNESIVLATTQDESDNSTNSFGCK